MRRVNKPRAAIRPLEIYRGNYSAYLRQREERFQARLRQWEQQQEYIHRLTVEEAHTLLGRFLFRGEELFKRVSELRSNPINARHGQQIR